MTGSVLGPIGLSSGHRYKEVLDANPITGHRHGPFIVKLMPPSQYQSVEIMCQRSSHTGWEGEADHFVKPSAI